jgi:hypothetical protein
LKQYEQRWDERFGKTFRRLHRIRHALLKIPEDKLSDIIRHAAQIDGQQHATKDLLLMVMKSQPSLLLEVVPYFLGQ